MYYTSVAQIWSAHSRTRPPAPPSPKHCAERRFSARRLFLGGPLMTHKPGLWRRWGSYRPAKSMLFWACVACTIATMVIGFNWGGWVTGGTAAKLVQQGRTNLAAELCVANFTHGLDVDAQLASLKKTSEWERAAFIKKGGWDTLSGLKETVTGAANLCAQLLVTEKVPAAKTASASG